MKKKLILLLICISPCLFLSCATAISVGKTIPKYEIAASYENPKMDFIGFKVDSNILSTSSSTKISTEFWTPNVDTVTSEFDQAKAIANTKSLRQLGYNLEASGIANNKADSYFGIYSLQEMELYKSDSRYVTFVEVAENKLDYKDNKGGSVIVGALGGGFVGLGLPMVVLGDNSKNDKYEKDLADSYATLGVIFTAVGIPFLIAALIPTETKINFTGMYNIYLYDTQTKSLIRKEVVSVNCSEKFKGSYTYDDSSKEIVRDYISQNVYNSLLQKYDDLNTWLKNR